MNMFRIKMMKYSLVKAKTYSSFSFFDFVLEDEIDDSSFIFNFPISSFKLLIFDDIPEFYDTFITFFYYNISINYEKIIII